MIMSHLPVRGVDSVQRDFRNKWGAIARALGDLQAFGPYSSVKVGLPRQCDAPQAIAVSLGSPDAALIADAIGLLGSWLVDTSSSLADGAGARASSSSIRRRSASSSPS